VGLPKVVHAQVMPLEATTLSHEEFASLLTVGNVRVNSAAPEIPAQHSARLVALGYMVDLAGRLRMTTPGRIRIYAGQLANWGGLNVMLGSASRAMKANR
jgi:hypothetical protein